MKRATFTRTLGGAVLLLVLSAMTAFAQTPAAGAGRRVITNKELEPVRLRREAQEAEYERTRRERGLPSREELRRRTEEDDRRLFEWARREAAERRQAELAALRFRAAQTAFGFYQFDPRPSQTPVVYVDGYGLSGLYPYQFVSPVRFGGFGRRGHFASPFDGRVRFGGPRWGFSFPSAPFARHAHRRSLPASPGLPSAPLRRH